MHSILTLSLLLLIACLGDCRDYYIGMFKKNDLLMAQDRLYKAQVPYRKTYAKYGRVFPCPITYFRIVDRLGYGGGPNVEVIRGGLRKKYIVARLTSPYNLPISVNIYVGCKKKIVKSKPSTTRRGKTDDTDESEDTKSTSDDTVTTGDDTVTTGDGEVTDGAGEEETTLGEEEAPAE